MSQLQIREWSRRKILSRIMRITAKTPRIDLVRKPTDQTARLAVTRYRCLRDSVAKSRRPYAVIVTIDRTGPSYIVTPTAQRGQRAGAAGTSS